MKPIIDFREQGSGDPIPFELSDTDLAIAAIARRNIREQLDALNERDQRSASNA